MEVRQSTEPYPGRPTPEEGLALVEPSGVGEHAAAEPRVAEALWPLFESLLGGRVPVRFEFWDGSGIGPLDAPGTVRIVSPDALRRVLWAPGELGFGRAYVAGDIEIGLDSDVFATLRALQQVAPRDLRTGLRALPSVVRSAARVGAIGPPPPPPAEEARPTGRKHSPRRDQTVVRHHYDVGNDFYRIVLGESMTYSCARFVEPTTSLEDAEAAKHELIARKLGLHEREGARLLDVGCGWGSMAIHAAERFGASVVGITLSPEQAGLARERVDAAGLAGRVEIRVQDYRDLSGEQFDAISSIGMFEHVGHERMLEYFATLRALLAPGGRLLNHAISKPGGSRLGRRSFIGRYVFPDGELLDVGLVVLAMQQAGFEVRDVESLREHYSQTLHHWVANLEASWDAAVRLVGPARARIWRLYMAGSAIGFDDAGIAIHQVLGVATPPGGASGMPRTRQDWG